MTTRIFVIEDEPDILELYRLLLEAEGYEVHATDTVHDGLSHVKNIQPHLIILDLMIGLKQEGWDFIDLLKQQPSTASIPLILCTAAEHELQGKLDSIKTSTVDVVFKPFDVDELLRVVKRLLLSSPIQRT
ncbi:response regulator [Dictyobacter arantiisoli]|uniref:Response regulatory domain-containing protein n=1 Tax=Dictyobacter arantiisoli TaxID=2014874 RepID=A0A5A5TJ55_9CHLR|nr:response regulator [Dictyobacter arantiisoli]GCF11029.1 hypothetical protein KDI_45930 [Dictyobacter arantiisoli]